MAEEIKPYSEEGSRQEQVEAMFDNIAPTYDRLNHSMAWSIDRWWRRKALKTLGKQTKETGTELILDIATGTGDLALDAVALLNPKHVYASDISEGMMAVGREKIKRAGLQDVISFRREDCMALTAEEGTYDAVISAYGLRNFPSLEKSFEEMLRVLKPGGKACLIELATPPHFPMRQLFHIYSHTVMPLLGYLLSRDIKAYKYLAKTIEKFPQAEVISQMLLDKGFSKVEHHRMTFGICTYFIATK